MSYLEFHAVFLLPPVLLLLSPAREGAVLTGGKVAGLCFISVAAFIYTSPWDGYLISRGVWGYGVGRVVGTVNGVPVEEYLFFILQPHLVGLWLYRVTARSGKKKVRESGARLAPRIVGSLSWVLAGVLGFLLLERGGHTLYLGLILAWSSPVLVAQWAYSGTWIWRERRDWLLGAVVPTLYLWLADDAAIHFGIWHVSSRYTTGLQVLGLLVEEALFFAVTNLMVVQGILLFSWVVRRMVSGGTQAFRERATDRNSPTPESGARVYAHKPEPGSATLMQKITPQDSSPDTSFRSKGETSCR